MTALVSNNPPPPASSPYPRARDPGLLRLDKANNPPQPPPGPPEPALRPNQALVLAKDKLSQPVAAAFCAGGVAGAVSRTVVSPLERLKILFQVQSAGRDAYKLSVGQALGKMWREEGWRGFMRGNGTNCIRIVPYSAVQFGSYNFYRRVRAACFLLPVGCASTQVPPGEGQC